MCDLRISFGVERYVMEQGMEKSSCGNSSNGGHRQVEVGEVVGGKVVLRGSDFSPPLFSL